jgi:predicted nuclease with TOPRIM domain
VQYTTLENNYNELESNYNDLNSARNSLLGDYNELQSDYDLLNSTHYSMNETYTLLQAEYNALNLNYTDLLSYLDNLQEITSDSESELVGYRIAVPTFIIAVVALVAFIIYLKRKEEEPYVVIRKETVSVKKDEDS